MCDRHVKVSLQSQFVCLVVPRPEIWGRTRDVTPATQRATQQELRDVMTSIV